MRVRSPQLESSPACSPPGASTPTTTAPTRSSSRASQEPIGQLAFDHGVVLHEIAAESSNLKDVFFDLTYRMEVAA